MIIYISKIKKSLKTQIKQVFVDFSFINIYFILLAFLLPIPFLYLQ